MPTPRGCDKAEVISVIKTVALKGAGTENYPCREVIQYWSLDGKLLADNDLPYNNDTVNEKN